MKARSTSDFLQDFITNYARKIGLFSASVSYKKMYTSKQIEILVLDKTQIIIIAGIAVRVWFRTIYYICFFKASARF